MEATRDSAFLAGMTGLMLANNPIGDNGAAALADAPGASGLRELQLHSCGLSRDGIVRLLASPYLGPGISAWAATASLPTKSGSGRPVTANVCGDGAAWPLLSRVEEAE